MQVQKPEKNISFPAMDREMLGLWERTDAFQKSISQRSSQKKFNFYDGPPFATGLPHFGHLLASALKDVFPRYFTMKGFRVERRWGWDCHGLPVEQLIQSELGLNGQADIQKLGIDKFNNACRNSVLRYTNEWETYIGRMGRWVDFRNQYRTMDKDFMESVWAVFKQLWDKNLVYEGKFVLSYSCALTSTLSNSEASSDYRDIQDPSITIRARLKGRHEGKFLLVWTTTPWTLPANLAIAVDPNGTYLQVKDLPSGEEYFVLKARYSAYWPKEGSAEIVREISGSDLVGSSYEPFFPQWVHTANAACYQVYGASFVDSETGTGSVHIAPAFGQDDFEFGKKYGLPILDHLDESGRFLPGNLAEVVGMNFKEGDKALLADLKKRGVVVRHETIVHAYPFCYRSGTPLIYRALPSWFVKVESLRERLIAANQQVHWVPEHLKEGRFGKWIENARDWNIARSRYWGNPIPIWKNQETGECVCVGSIAELQKYTDKPIEDLHMEFIDHIEIPSPTGRGVLKRVPYVFDCWFESGSMPYAQLHYPFENKDNFDELFPADFICEGLDQTRGWFYNLMNLSVALFDKPAFKNVVVNGLILAADGQKMSKSKKNFPDPIETIEKYGADSLRLFLLNSPATAGDEMRFDEENVKEATRKILLPFWNAYSFFATYASLDKFDPETQLQKSENELDRWILLRANQLLGAVDSSMRAFHIAEVVPQIINFFDDLNNWYVRRNRRRFWNSDLAAYSTLYEVLVLAAQILAPLAPFAAEFFFQKLALTPQLRAAESVHLSLLPDMRPLTADEEKLCQRMSIAQRVIELGRTIRATHKLKNKQPLKSITVGVVSPEAQEAVRSMAAVICDELNVKELEVTLDASSLARIVVKPNLKLLGKTLGPRIKELQQLLAQIPVEKARSLQQGHNATLGEFTLTPDMVLVELQGLGAKLVACEGDLVSALDPEITEELRMEGLARELVSFIQKARKQADFEVEDRIHVSVDSSNASLMKAIFANRDYIEEETLSSLQESALPAPELQQTCLLEKEEITLRLARPRV